MLAKSCSPLFIIVCLIGFTGHTLMICRSYFSFETTTVVGTDNRDTLKVPNFALCGDYMDVLSNMTVDEKGKRELNLTIRQIFDRTPDVNSIVLSCYYRKSDNPFVSLYGNQTICNQVFNISKAYMKQSICYKFVLSNSYNAAISWRRISHSLRSSKVIYSLILDPIFDEMRTFKPIIFTGYLPVTSRNYAPVLVRMSSIFSKRKISPFRCQDYTVTFSSLRYFLKPWPYDTRCSNTGGKDHCFRRCIINQSVKKLNKLPFTEIITQPLNLTHLSYADILDPIMRQNVSVLSQDCRAKCTDLTCDSIVIGTHTFCTIRKMTGIRFRINTTSAVMKRVYSREKSDFATFFNQLLNCMGIWFGVSIYALNPFSHRPAAKKLRIHAQKLFHPTQWHPNITATNWFEFIKVLAKVRLVKSLCEFKLN